MRATYLLKESTGLVFLVNHIWRDRLACVSGCSARIFSAFRTLIQVCALKHSFFENRHKYARVLCASLQTWTRWFACILLRRHYVLVPAQALRPNSSSCSCVHNCFVLRGNPNLWARAASRRKALMNSICEMKPSALTSICRKTAEYCSGQK